ncbi:hypothetical protein CCP3SC5AM1_170012 [Gammaproteobacteria bacterium]
MPTKRQAPFGTSLLQKETYPDRFFPNVLFYSFKNLMNLRCKKYNIEFIKLMLCIYAFLTYSLRIFRHD